MALTTYPLDNIDYTADDAALFHCTRTTGIYAGDDFGYTVTGNSNTIRLQPGIAWMRLGRFKGVVAALKVETAVDLDIPDATLPRIDHVVLQYDANKNATEVVVKQGTPASSPKAPNRSKSEALYEIHLYQILRTPGETAVTAGSVTDLRLNAAYCGLMADSVTKIDTSKINSQAQALIDDLRKEIAGVKDGSGFALKSYVDGKHVKTTVNLRTSGWSGNVQTVSVSGVTASNSVIVAAAPASREAYADAGVYCSAQASGKLTFTAEDTPTENLTVNVLIVN